jgi:hypothetical protein
MGITHESDDSFRAWDKVRTEFLSTLKKLMNLDYENIILISHEDTSKDITKKGGDKITAIKPNLQEKTANKVAGMVDIVARVVADGEIRTLSFKTNEVIFGGGRLTASTNEIPLDYAAFLEVYEEANKNAVAKMKGEEPKTTASNKGTGERKGRTSKKNPTDEEKPLDEENMTSDYQSEPVEEPENVPDESTDEEPVEQSDPIEEPVQEEPKTKTRSRKARNEEPKEEPAAEPEQDEAPKTRTRRKRGE